jgi:2,4-dienoyl-CoA reductase-like NADH-dependent reductase (Old Yellow Enzyme family)
MCQYSSIDGMATDWHLVHLGSRAVGGAGLVMVEATAVQDIGRISPQDMGIWADKHIEPLARIASFVEEQGAVPAIQLAHAGRKASTPRPWDGGVPIPIEKGGWQVVGPSPIPFDDGYQTPVALDAEGIRGIIQSFTQACRRALYAGFKVIEIHSAHGYLLHSFLSPLSNKREDEYGGSFENRIRLVIDVAKSLRAIMPEQLALFVRISATDWADGGWDIEQSVELSKQLKTCGVDLIDCSSGALVPRVRIPVAAGYQVPFAERIKRDANILTGAVGLITEPEQAEAVIADGKADIVLLARQMLRDPYWASHAARKLGVVAPWPIQYGRAAD